MKKTSITMIACMIVAGIILNTSVASGKEMPKRIRMVQGVVTAINPDQNTFTLDGLKGQRKGYVVPAIVEPYTKILIRGKSGTLDEIKPNDKISLVYQRTDNLYAREIVKR